jgi:putative MATE family efflux protein
MKLFQQAVRGDIKDFTTGSVDRAIFLLAIPMVLEMLLESTFAIVDIFFVNKLGTEASATVGLTEACLSILYSVAWGLAMGVTAMVARRAGEKNFAAASGITVQAIFLAVGFSVLIGFVGYFFPGEILHFMGASSRVVEHHYRFTQVMLTGNIVIMLLFVNNAVFRGAGDASVAMKALLLSNLVNIVLDPLLIFGFGPFGGMGVVGAAIATTTGRALGVLFQFYHLFKGNDLVKLAIRQFRVSTMIMLKILRTSAGGMFQFIIGSCSWIFLARIIAKSGDAATAGYITAIRICIFTILPGWGLANAAATLVGQNLGAGQPARAEQSVWRSAFLAFCFFALVGIVFFIFGEQLMRLFTRDKVAILSGTQCLHILAVGYVFFAYGMTISQAFNGAGDTTTPTYINLLVFWVIQIPLAGFLADHLEMGPRGVYIAIGVAESLLAVLSILVFKRGKWKLVKV